MTRRGFGQYCGLTRALEVVGERWALLILRDLMVQPRRYTDLLEGLPGIPTNLLATRLRELEESGVIERRIAPASHRGVVYALTPIGRALEPSIRTLGQWGTTLLGDPQPDEIVTPAVVVTAVRAAFDAQAARGLTATWEIHAGELTVHAETVGGKLESGVGPAGNTPDLVMTFRLDGLPSYPALIQAAKCGLVELDGDRKLLDTFLRVFGLTQAAQPGAKPGTPGPNE
ncbi:helix-turn-helix domain-containing protein [Streptomyces sp. KS_5]|uniref:winged helix-turn-helix transcriptional regulator n=1 Tax=Streptomyces sp. KS_5 TaxID=1881018 RepID=UPI00089BFA33|nr:helix-turn-helix domain-containing protein [Streptomyces sp. KS_5]SEE35659.1 transcriptional regulator, HxlR family [Streptomyces sp. KS_5]